jgi:hypothetical protein
VIVQPISDLHTDARGFGGFPPPATGVDLVLAAGNVREGLAAAIGELRRAYPAPIQICVAAGNHEFWGSVWADEIREGRRAAQAHGVHFLENRTVHVNSLRIVGCTLWTSYDLFGESFRPSAMRAAYDEVRDHKRIKWSSRPWLRFRPQEARALHLKSRSFIKRELAKKHHGPTLILTHFPPTAGAVAPAHRCSMTTAAACSDLLHMLDRKDSADYWIFGHTHRAMDRRHGRTRLISNPVGYAGENTGFDASLTFEVHA